MKLTPRQEETLDSSRHMVVTAGAGTGKTRVLVERYLSVLHNDPRSRPRDLLALTFTEKASAEMKERIRESIFEIAESDEEWEESLAQLETCDISTIHSFCARIVRSEPMACGVDPEFRVLTESESLRIRRRAIDELFLHNGRESGALRRMIVDYGPGSTRKMLGDLIMQSSRFRGARSIGSSKETSIRFLVDAEVELGRRFDDVIPDVRELVDSLSALPIPESGTDTGVRFISDIEPLRDAFQSPSGGEEPRMRITSALHLCMPKLMTKDLKKSRRFGSLGSSRLWGRYLGRLRDSASRLSEIAEEHMSFIIYDARPDLRERARERLEDLFTIYEALIERYDQHKERINGLDFDDLLVKAAEVLEENVNDILDKLRSRYKHILVDEFQDTDSLQWRMIELIWNRGADCTLFLVGDPKQSIYGFRSADVRLFSSASDSIRGHNNGGVVVLDRNFRSKMEIMDFINHLFPRVLGESGEGWKVPFDPLDAHRESGGSISIIGVAGKADREYREGVEVSRVIKRALREGWTVDDDRPITPGDIAILIPARTRFQRYEEAFRDEGIPFQVYKGKGFFERQEVKDILALLSFITNPRDDVSLAAVLRGPLFGYSDEHLLRISRADGDSLFDRMNGSEEFGDCTALLKRFQDFAAHLPPTLALERMVVEGCLPALLDGLRGARNLSELLDWARNESGARTLADLRRTLAEVVEEPPKQGEPSADIGGDTITIMTVHAAKGLEWPMVTVMGLHHGRRPMWSNIIVDPDRGLSLRVFDPRFGMNRDTPAVELGRETVDEMEEEERKRLFYVACTRAKDHLLLSGWIPDPTAGEDPSGMMEYLWNGLDLDESAFAEGSITAGEVEVSLKRVGETPEEVDEEDIGGYEMPDMGGSKGSPKLLSPIELSGGEPFKSPTDPEIADIIEVPAGYTVRMGSDKGIPDTVSGADFGEMVHRIMEGIPIERVMREMGYSPRDDQDIRERLESTVLELEKYSEVDGGTHWNEVELVVSLKSKDGREVPVLGRIDRLIRNEDGTYEILDFKTGKMKDEYATQLRVYKMMVEGITGKKAEARIVN